MSGSLERMRTMSNVEALIEDEEYAKLPSLITPYEAALIVHVTERAIVNYCARGYFKARKIGRLWRINTRSLLSWAGLDIEERAQHGSRKEEVETTFFPSYDNILNIG